MNNLKTTTPIINHAPPLTLAGTMCQIQQFLSEQHIVNLIISFWDLDWSCKDLLRTIHYHRMYIRAISSRPSEEFSDFPHSLGVSFDVIAVGAVET